MNPPFTRHFAALFVRQHLRTAWRHPVVLGMNVLSIALGVAVFLAIQIANRSARESFRAGIELVAGRANLEIRGTIDDAIFPQIRDLPGVRAATPIIEGIVTIPTAPGEYLRVLGLDPFSGTELRTFELLGADRAQVDFEAWLRRPDAIAVTSQFAEDVLPQLASPGNGDAGVSSATAETPPARRIGVLAAGRTHQLFPAYTLEPEDAAASSDPRLVAMDISWAQELLDRPGELSAILLLVDESALASVTAAARELVPADVSVAPPARRGEQVDSMLGAFQLNLTALSMVSVLVGTFLIYNTISASVVRRQPEIGTLRALGASRVEVRALFLAEAGLAGIVGSLLGIVLALPLAAALAAPVEQTINSLYVALSITDLFIGPGQIALALAVGIGASLAAAWIPASEAASCDPARVLRRGSAIDRFHGTSVRWLVAGAASLALAALTGWAALAFRLAPLGFLSAFCVLAGFSLIVPAAVTALAASLEGAPPFLRIAARNLVRSNHRNSITIAALAAAIAMTVSISVMIHSFRGSVNDWIDSTLVADLFIGSAANEVAGVQVSLPPDAVNWMESQPGVTGVATFSEVATDFRGERTAFAIVGGSRPEPLQFIGGSRADQHATFLQTDHVAVSEPFANRFNVRAGDTLNLATPAGDQPFTVAGIYQDYARNGGVISLTAANYAQHFPPAGTQSLAITLTPGTDPTALGERFRAHFTDAGQFSIYSNQSLRQRIFEIFDQTFAVTMVLRSIAVAVAAAGVLLALLILAAEREREIGVLRATGASRLQVVGLFLREAALIGLTASVVGVASGACLAVVLTWVVNKAYFGWTISLAYPITLLAATPLWIIPVAILAAIIPAWKAAQTPPAAALRFE